MLPTNIQLIFRLIKGSELTAAEMDNNMEALRDAILAIAELLGANRVVIGAEPPLGEREGVLWIPVANIRQGIFRWDSGTSAWVRVTTPALYGQSGGAANAYTVSLPVEFADYAAMTGHAVMVKVHADNTGATTINFNTLGATAVKKYTATGMTDLVAGDLKTGGMYVFSYDGNRFILLNPTPAAAPVTGPVFITPQVVYSGAAVAASTAWATYDASVYIPVGAKAVILEFYGEQDNALDGGAQLEVRKDLAGQTYVGMGIGAVDGCRAGCQGIFECSSTRTFDTRAVIFTSVFNFQIRLIGYIV
jgi:hypothetical protein